MLKIKLNGKCIYFNIIIIGIIKQIIIIIIIIFNNYYYYYYQYYYYYFYFYYYYFFCKFKILFLFIKPNFSLLFHPIIIVPLLSIFPFFHPPLYI